MAVEPASQPLVVCGHNERLMPSDLRGNRPETRVERRRGHFSGTVGRFIGVRGHFHLNFICAWLCVFTRSETPVKKFYSIVSCQLKMQLILQGKCLEV